MREPSANGAVEANPIRVLVVEDSITTRELLVQVLRADGRFTVVGVAGNGEDAVTMAARLKPDVITMDILLPRLDGLAATRRIMAETPTPIVVVSANVEQKTVGLAFEALQAGSVSVLDTPPGPDDPRHPAAVGELLTTLRLMSEVKVVRRTASTGGGGGKAVAGARLTPLVDPPLIPTLRPQVIGIAASTGGPQAIQLVLQALGGDLPAPVLIVQHISSGFAAGMASWLSATCPQPVRLASNGDEMKGGVVYLAPEGHHLLVTRKATLVLSKSMPVRGFRPSATILFESLAECYGARAIGVILTGMGDDGVSGLNALRSAGGITIAQDELTSVVNGMPGAAVAAGAAGRVLPLPVIGPAVRGLLGLHSPRAL